MESSASHTINLPNPHILFPLFYLEMSDPIQVHTLWCGAAKQCTLPNAKRCCPTQEFAALGRPTHPPPPILCRASFSPLPLSISVLSNRMFPFTELKKCPLLCCTSPYLPIHTSVATTHATPPPLCLNGIWRCVVHNVLPYQRRNLPFSQLLLFVNKTFIPQKMHGADEARA